MVNNKLDRSFGTAGSTAGVVLFVTGLAVCYFSPAGLILAVSGAFVGFSGTSTLIDIENKRIKFSNNLLGFIRLGKWINIEPDMKLGIKRSKRAWRTYSRSNRRLDMVENDFRIFLYDAENRQIMPVKKTGDLKTASTELEKLVEQLGISNS